MLLPFLIGYVVMRMLSTRPVLVFVALAGFVMVVEFGTHIPSFASETIAGMFVALVMLIAIHRLTSMGEREAAKVIGLAALSLAWFGVTQTPTPHGHVASTLAHGISDVFEARPILAFVTIPYAIFGIKWLRCVLSREREKELLYRRYRAWLQTQNMRQAP